MKLIIDIDEETFNKLPEAELGSNVVADVLEAVENGTVLPKGHGRLIDADDLLDNTCIDEIPTIIEADVPKRRKGIPLEENDSGYNCENWIP